MPTEIQGLTLRLERQVRGGWVPASKKAKPQRVVFTLGVGNLGGGAQI